jgi:hypothetical protein
VTIVQDVRRVELRTRQRALTSYVGRDVVESKVIGDVGKKVNVGVARKERKLRIAVGAVFLQ